MAYSASLSLEDPGGHARAPVVDATNPGFFAVNAAIAGDTAFSQQTGDNNGFRMPDIVVNLRVDQPWGFAGVSAALHEVGGAYYGTPNNVNNGHPADRHGWAVSAGGKLNLAGGDIVGINVCYTEGALGYCTRQGTGQLYNASTSVAAGWIGDGVFTTGTEIELTRAWSVQAAYEHIWSPRWKTSVFGGYAKVDYNDTATGILNSALVAGSVCARPFAGLTGNLSAVRADVGNSCNPDYGILRNRHAYPVESGAAARYRFRVALHGPNHRVQRGGTVHRQCAAAGRPPDRRSGCVVDDVPLAAQLLSVIGDWT